MLQDLQMPSHGHTATGLGPMAAEATVCMSLLIVAVQHSVLCVCLWPRSATAAASQCLAGERSAKRFWLSILMYCASAMSDVLAGCYMLLQPPACLSVCVECNLLEWLYLRRA